MGDVIRLDDRRRGRRLRGAEGARPARPRIVFHCDPASPWTYLAAERVDRRLAGVEWSPVCPGIIHSPTGGLSDGAVRVAAEARALEVGMPMVWPERGLARTPAAARVAALAAERSRVGDFTLAAGRLAFCGGYDLDDPEVLAEAAAAAGLDLDEALAAARDAERDRPGVRAAAHLARVGAVDLPLLEVAGGGLYCGERRIAEAFAAVAHRSATLRPAAADEHAV